MAKEKVELLTELQNGFHSFTFIGKAKVSSDTFKPAAKSDKSNWYGVNSQFGVETTPGNVVYPKIQGGYMLDNPNLILMGKKNGERVTIAWEHRKNEEMLKSVENFVFYNIGIEKDSEGKRVYKRFVNAIDVQSYLSEVLQDGMPIKVTGNVEYSEGKDGQTYKNYTLKSVQLNEGGFNSEGEEVPPAKPTAYIKQTYLANEDTLDRNWEKTFKKDGEISVALKVPQYLSKRKKSDGSYAAWKKVTPLTLTVVFRESEMKGKTVEGKIQMINKLINVKSGVQEVGMLVSVNEGYTETKESSKMNISSEMQELIDMGLISEDDIESQVNTRGQRVSELLFNAPAFVEKEGEMSLAINDNKYAPEALYLMDIDDEDELSSIPEVKTESKPKVVEVEEKDELESAQEIDFDSMFN